MCIKDWIQRTFGRTSQRTVDGATPSKEAPSPPDRAANWLEPDHPGNPFGVRLLDLMDNLKLLATTSDPSVAARAVGWQAGGHRDVDVVLEGEAFDCDLRYPCVPRLPDGFLFRPDSMETKWVLAYRDGVVALARSWTGETQAIATAHHEGDTLVLTRLVVAPESGLDMFGDPVATFDWVMRTHALGARIPLSVDEDGAAMLARIPTLGFTLYGKHLFCAAIEYAYGPPTGGLYSDGELAKAVGTKDLASVRRLLAEGHPTHPPIGFNNGSTVLHLALYLDASVANALLDAGADVNIGSFKGSTPLMAAMAGGAPAEVVERLLASGAQVEAEDVLGFRPLHVAAESGNESGARQLLAAGAEIDAQTHAGVTPLHIAAGLGKAAVGAVLLEGGADALVRSADGTAREIAVAEGHDAMVALLEEHGVG